jgi:hypothetical protein
VFVDPAVSRKKFERELGDFCRFARAYQRRGIFLIDAEFPEVFALFVATQAKPAPMVPFAAVLNFSDYDVSPPSVQLVNPFTRAKLKRSEIPYDFLRMLPTAPDPAAGGNPQVQPLLQAFVNERPFICLQGIREYHESPAHTGDSWFLHRGTGQGTLTFLLDVLARYGAEPIRGPGINVHLNVSGFAVAALPG